MNDYTPNVHGTCCSGNMYFAGVFPQLPEGAPYGWVAFESDKPYVYDGEEWLPFWGAATEPSTPQGGCSCPAIGDGLEITDENLQAGYYKLGAGLVVENNTVNSNAYYRVVYDPDINNFSWFNSLAVPDNHQAGNVYFDLDGRCFWGLEGANGYSIGIAWRNFDDPSVRMTAYGEGNKPRYIGDIYAESGNDTTDWRLVTNGGGQNYKTVRIDNPTGVIYDSDAESESDHAGGIGGSFFVGSDGKLYYQREFGSGATFLIGEPVQT